MYIEAKYKTTGTTIQVNLTRRKFNYYLLIFMH